MKAIHELLAYHNVRTKNEQLYETAFTHPSYLNEHPEITVSYQRLEFLGDAVLSFLASTALYSRFGDAPEGYLTDIRAALVRTEALAEISRSLKLGEYVRLSKGEEAHKGSTNEHILADVCEAFLGALYLDQGIDKASEFFHKEIEPRIDQIIEEKKYIDPKTTLQEMVQSQHKKTPQYETVSFDQITSLFTVRVLIQNQEYGQGSGKSKKIAEQEAAKIAIARLTSA